MPAVSYQLTSTCTTRLRLPHSYRLSNTSVGSSWLCSVYQGAGSPPGPQQSVGTAAAAATTPTAAVASPRPPVSSLMVELLRVVKPDAVVLQLLLAVLPASLHQASAALLAAVSGGSRLSYTSLFINEPGSSTRWARRSAKRAAANAQDQQSTTGTSSIPLSKH